MTTEQSTFETELNRLCPDLTLITTRIPARPDVEQDDTLDGMWNRAAVHFKCDLRRGARSMTVYYSKGSGHRKWTHPVSRIAHWAERSGDLPCLKGKILGDISTPSSVLSVPWADPKTVERVAAFVEAHSTITRPTRCEVVAALLLDGEAMSMTFENWCADFGYDTDSRKAEQTYHQCDAHGKALRNLVGSVAYETLRHLAHEI